MAYYMSKVVEMNQNKACPKSQFDYVKLRTLKTLLLSLSLFSLVAKSTFPICVSCQIMKIGSLFNELREFPKYKPRFSPNILIRV